MTQMEKGWLERLQEEFSLPYMKELEAFLLEEEKLKKEIYPPRELLFNALCQTPFEEVKVAIVGQDPYHGPGQAHGLSFSVPKKVPIPPSLQNIFKELFDDLKVPIPLHGSLEEWAKRGVLLLNATLTVRAHEPKSHYGRGWERFTDRILSLLLERKDPVVFLLWGKSAQEKLLRLQVPKQHLVLQAPHPSPFSAHTGFLGCRHFSKADAFLESIGKKKVFAFSNPGE